MTDPTHPTLGSIPQSDVLAEASPTSIGDLINSDPELYSRADRDHLVSVLRAQRAQWKIDEESGAKKKAKKNANLVTSIDIRAEDLDL